MNTKTVELWRAMIIEYEDNKMNEDNGLKTAIVLGASGLVGGELLKLLLDDNSYGKIVAFVRRDLGTTHAKLTQHIVDFDRPETYAHLVCGDVVFCCLGTTIKQAGSREAFRRVDYEYPVAFARAAAIHGVAHYAIVTSVGADVRSSVFYLRTKGECENAVKAAGVKTVSVFRPAWLMGNRKQSRFGETITLPLLKLISPLILRGAWRKYRPIQATQVAKAMLVVAQKTQSGFSIYQSDEIEGI